MNYLLQNGVEKALTTPAAAGLNAGGTAFMALSVGFVVILLSWCFHKVLTVPAPQDEATPPPGYGP
jgi:hypothetical protein